MTKGRVGVWNGPKKDDVIYEQPLTPTPTRPTLSRPTKNTPTIPVTPTLAKPTKSATPMTTPTPATTPTKTPPSPPITTLTSLTTNLHHYTMATACCCNSKKSNTSLGSNVSAFHRVLRRDCLPQQWSLETYSGWKFGTI